MVENFVYTVHEAHIEHLVRLVEHHGVHRGKTHDLAVDKVDKAPGSGHYYLSSAAERAYLAFDARTAIHRDYFHVGHVFGKVGEVAGYLQA